MATEVADPQVLLTLTQGSVLSQLLNGGPRRMSTLADLERLGLVSRRRDPVDGRAVLVEVAEVGQRFHRRLIVAREEFLRDRPFPPSPGCCTKTRRRN